MPRLRFALLAHFSLVALFASVSSVAQVAAGNKPPREMPTMGASDADPFDLVTGIYHREYPDLLVQDSIPLSLVRTQRTLDDRSRAFGIGASTSYDMFIALHRNQNRFRRQDYARRRRRGTLTCSSAKIHVPPDISAKLQAMGDEHKIVVSRECQSVEQRRLDR